MLTFYDKTLGCNVLVVGDYVSVCTRATGKQFIDFLDVREGAAGKFYCSEDSPVAGGLSIEAAKKVVGELAQAISLMEKEMAID